MIKVIEMKSWLSIIIFTQNKSIDYMIEISRII